MFAHSIRWRLQIWLGFLLACVLTGFGATAYKLYSISQLDKIDEELERRAEAIRDAMTRPPFRPRPGPPPFERKSGRPDFEHNLPPSGDEPGRRGFDRERKFMAPPDFPKFDREAITGWWNTKVLSEISHLFAGEDTNDFYYAFWWSDGQLIRSSTNAPPDLPIPDRLKAHSRTTQRARGYFREVFFFGGLGDCVLVGRHIKADLEAMQRFAWWLLAAGGLVLALGLGGAWGLTTHAIRPVEEISAAARRISAGNLAERIKVGHPENELGQLAGVLNSTFARLDAAFAQQKQFTADAAHELRTPLAVLISEAQTTLARERNAAEYRETVAICLDTAQQMRRLTESLLELARFDAGQERIRHAPFDLAEVAQACLERVRPLAMEHQIQIRSDLAPAQLTGDADRLSQVFTNLLTNAIYYNRPKGEILLRTHAENGTAVITVADTGQGISTEDIPHLFKRFYRADKARSAAAGRNGLGLAICKAIVEAHRGAIDVQSQLGVGTTFTVRLPAAREQSGELQIS